MNITRALLESILIESDHSDRIASMVGSDTVSSHASKHAAAEIDAAYDHPVGSALHNKHMDEHMKWRGVHSTIMKHYYTKHHRPDLAAQHERSAANIEKSLHNPDAAYSNKSSHHWSKF